MAESLQQTALRRKISARGGAATMHVGGMTPERAMRNALMQAGEGYSGLSVKVTDVVSRRTDQAHLLEEIPEVALFITLEGGGRARGLVCLSSGMVDALIEAQTVRRVEAVERPPRVTTRIDAALTRDYVDNLLVHFGEWLSLMPEASWGLGYQYSAYVPEARSLTMILEECEYRVQRGDVGLGKGAKTATVWLALPAIGPGGKAQSRAQEGNQSISPAERMFSESVSLWTKALRKTLQSAPVRMQAVLARTNVPFSQIEKFKIDDTISVSRSTLHNVSLETVIGAKGLHGVLGQKSGMRAIRLRLELPGAQPALPPEPTSANSARPPAQVTLSPDGAPDTIGAPDTNDPAASARSVNGADGRAASAPALPGAGTSVVSAGSSPTSAPVPGHAPTPDPSGIK